MNHRRSKALLWLAALGIALQAIVPAGYMPAPIAGGLPFVLCPGGLPGAAVLVAGDADARHGTHDTHREGEHRHADGEREPAFEWQFCPFGAIVGSPALIAEYDAPSPLAERNPLAIATDHLARPAATRPWRARAPPTDQPIDV